MADGNQVVESSYDLAVVDPNSMLFLFKHAPEVAKGLDVGSEFSLETATVTQPETWMVWLCFCLLTFQVYNLKISFIVSYMYSVNWILASTLFSPSSETNMHFLST